MHSIGQGHGASVEIPQFTLELSQLQVPLSFTKQYI